jgi:hypothetical protein
MPDLIQSAKWPGVTAVESCYGTVSHGVAPATFVLATYPQTSFPQQTGVLMLSDGFRSVALKGCRVDRMTARAGPGGQTFELDVLDRRWRWRSPLAGYGTVSGRYNRTDTRGKLIPWSIRSPEELARECFKALGERNFVIDLPRGLSRSVGRDVGRYLRLGENFAQSFANPEMSWDLTVAAEALSRLCDYFGRRLAYQVVADRFVVARLGVGAALPEAPYEARTPAASPVAPPSRVVVAGAPVRIQARFRLEAVGREWDDMYVPIDDLSYAPRGPGQVQKSEVVFVPGTGAPPPLTVRVGWTGESGGEVYASAAAGGATVADLWAQLAAELGRAGAGQVVAMSSAANRFALQGLKEGQEFTVELELSAGLDEEDRQKYRVDLIQQAAKAGPSWATSEPPSFTPVRPTDRLSYAEAVERARDTVFRCYRIVNADPADRLKPLALPWFGRVARRQQVILQDARVEQVVPAPRIADGANKGLPVPGGVLNQGVLPEFYNGYSRDREAVVTGAVYALAGTVTWNPGANSERFPNTLPTDRVFVPFSVDPVEQLVKFAEPVYRLKPLGDRFLLFQPADLILETGCLVCDEETDQVVRWKESLSLGGLTPPEEAVREDLQVGVIGRYGDRHALQGFTLLDAADTKRRAEYYLLGMAAKYRATGAESRQYVGIWPIDLDGAVQQVTWSMNPAEGPTTIVSRNSEHSAVILPYPTRRKAENLSPDGSAAAANAVERAAIEKYVPKPRRRTDR